VAQARAAWSAAAGTRASDPPDAELDYVDELQHNWQDRSGVRSGDSSLASDELDLLRPHVVNLRMGRFSNDGLMTGSEADVDRLFDEALPAWIGQLKTDQVPRVVFYAHGGLVKESTALKSALATRRWWLDNGVYPIYFVWETGLFETLGSMLHRGRDQLAPVGERGVISDRITDPLLEELVRALGAQRIWGAMKASAYFASAEKGGARYVAKKLATFVKGAGKSAELHAVGHSAGSIFHAHFLPVCRDVAKTGFPGFKTLQLLAPAINCEDFKQHLMPLGGQAGGVASMTMFTMRKDLERADNCAAVYRKSLLYLVSEACEDQRKTPILGLEQSLRNDSAIKAFFGLGLNAPAVAEVVWSKSPLVEGRSATRATRHGDFDNDAPTMTSVVRRILGKGEIDPVLPFPKQASTGDRSLANEWLSEVDWPDWAVGSGLPATALLPGTTPPTVSAASSSGRRLAVCIGIDAYSRAPLQGCVNDARRWSETLRSFGFDVEKLENDKADRDGILKALRDLIAHSRAGDTLVFQYAGHGTQLEDLDGDEADGDTPGYDEAIVPYGYESGAFVIDDDIAAIVTTLPADVRLTFLLDCCHSGTGTRFAVGGALTPRTQGDSRARRLPATPEMMVAHRRFRQGSGSRGFAAGIGARNASHTMREITLAACQSHELAYETGGQGDFTRLAHQVLARRVAGLTNVGFYESVLQEFGPGPRQRPRLDCDLTVRTAPLLGIAWS
jgi:hypothetical protein